MPKVLKLAAVQSRTLNTTAATLNALEATAKRAAAQSIDLVLFPEAYLGGYPRTCNFGATVGARSDEGREQFMRHFHDAVDMGDTPAGAGKNWVDRKLELPRGKEYRGDGTREELERIARETNVFIITGLVERCAGTLYCGVVYVCPRYGVLGKRRKVMPTGSERLIWGQGSASTLRAVTTEIRGIRLCIGSAICWENYMPLLRQSLYSQNVNLWLAPTADARSAWEALMRTVGCEGRCFVMSANQCVRKRDLPVWISKGTSGDTEGRKLTNGHTSYAVDSKREEEVSKIGSGRRRSTITVTEEKHEICWPIIEAKNEQEHVNSDSSAIETSSAPEKKDNQFSGSQTLAQADSFTNSHDNEFACRGGSLIASPTGEVIAGPVWEIEDELLVAEVDFEDCERGRLDFDCGGSYSRMDSFRLSVEGLDLSPPPL